MIDVPSINSEEDVIRLCGKGSHWHMWYRWHYVYTPEQRAAMEQASCRRWYAATHGEEPEQ